MPGVNMPKPEQATALLRPLPATKARARPLTGPFQWVLSVTSSEPHLTPSPHQPLWGHSYHLATTPSHRLQCGCFSNGAPECCSTCKLEHFPLPLGNPSKAPFALQRNSCLAGACLFALNAPARTIYRLLPWPIPHTPLPPHQLP